MAQFHPKACGRWRGLAVCPLENHWSYPCPKQLRWLPIETVNNFCRVPLALWMWMRWHKIYHPCPREWGWPWVLLKCWHPWLGCIEGRIKGKPWSVHRSADFLVVWMPVGIFLEVVCPCSQSPSSSIWIVELQWGQSPWWVSRRNCTGQHFDIIGWFGIFQWLWVCSCQAWYLRGSV